MLYKSRVGFMTMLYKDSMKVLTEHEFNHFVLHEYKPSQYECDEVHDERFREGTYYPYVCRTRCFLTYREIADHLPVNSRIVDFGFYPGTLLRQMKMLFNEKIECYGAGQKVDRSFEEFMRPYVQQCVQAEFDPFYAMSKTGGLGTSFEDQTFDAVIATEILEHLISPLEMIAEGARILKQGGLYIITTPNVSHIGAVVKLLRGRSNYERLDRSPMFLQHDPWRGHIRFYDKHELIDLFRRNGLALLKHQYYLERGWDHAKWPLMKRVVINVIDKIIPRYRESHFAVFIKK